ncbi:MAG: PucR family transcriptional regulator, partial [Acidimicrobiia bacterium]
MATIATRIAERLDEIGEAMVESYRAEIVDYAVLDEKLLHTDVKKVSLDNLAALLDHLEEGDLMGEEDRQMVREAAARRVHQNVSLESLLHAYRLWGQHVWDAILSASLPGDAREREAALRIAGRVIQHINRASTLTARGYLDEMQGVWSDREVLQRDLLEELIAGKGATERARRLTEELGLVLGEAYYVIVAHLADLWHHEPELRPLASRKAMRRALETCKTILVPQAGSLIVGIRQEEIVSLYPAGSLGQVERAKQQWTRCAAAIAPDGFAMGIGGIHPGLDGVSAGYIEAREAVQFARKPDALGTPVAFDDVLVDYILQSSPLADRLSSGALGPLRAYDQAKGAGLLDTLR